MTPCVTSLASDLLKQKAFSLREYHLHNDFRRDSRYFGATSVQFRVSIP